MLSLSNLPSKTAMGKIARKIPIKHVIFTINFFEKDVERKNNACKMKNISTCLKGKKECTWISVPSASYPTYTHVQKVEKVVLAPGYIA